MNDKCKDGMHGVKHQPGRKGHRLEGPKEMIKGEQHSGVGDHIARSETVEQDI